MLVKIVGILVFIQLALSQNPSPCPEIFSYEPRVQEEDRWYGVIALQSRDDLDGVWLKITLDRPAELLGNWFGEATSTDNQEFTVKNPRYKLEAGPPVSVRFFVKYNAAYQIPSLKSIKLNGKTICTTSREEAISTTPKLHISKPATTRPNTRPAGRPASSNTDSVYTNGQSSSQNTRPNTRPSSTSSDSVYPNNGQSSQNTRPNNRPSSTNTDSVYLNNGQSSSQNTRPNSQPSSRPISTHTTGNGQDTRPSVNNIPREPERPIRYDQEVTTQNYQTNNRRPSSSNNELSTNNHQRESTNSGTNSNGLSVEDDTGSQDFDFFPGDFAIHHPSQTRPPSRPSVLNKRNAACGTVAMKPSPLISYGQNTTQGQWPWHTALYHTQGAQLLYTCGATLISESHVLTAAHCVAKPQTNRAIDTKRLAVYLGKYSLKRFGSGTQDREVSDIFIHPQYNYSVYFNDIAVLKLKTPVDITNYVRPCCLWEDNSDIDSVLNKLGTVVGWGFDENRQISDVLMQAQMPVVSTVKCIYSNREFFSQFTFEKNYCAGFRNGTTVCNGDSGGGMVFPKSGTSGQNTVWQIRGIVSVGVALQGQGVCDPSHYIVFTDVAKHLDWIKRVMNE